VHIFLDRDFLADADEVGRDVDLLAVHAHVAVQHELPGLRARGRQAGAPHRVIETTLQHDNQVLARRALHAHRFFKVVAELALEQAVGALHLLLFAQLQAVADHLGAPRLAVLPRYEVALFNGALLGKAAQAL
jgi:hypothetical protein